MLREVFLLTIAKERDGIAIYSPPMVVSSTVLDHYPTAKEIETAIDGAGGEFATVSKSYKKA